MESMKELMLFYGSWLLCYGLGCRKDALAGPGFAVCIVSTL